MLGLKVIRLLFLSAIHFAHTVTPEVLFRCHLADNIPTAQYRVSPEVDDFTLKAFYYKLLTFLLEILFLSSSIAIERNWANHLGVNVHFPFPLEKSSIKNLLKISCDYLGIFKLINLNI